MQAASVVGVHRAEPFLRYCFAEGPYYHTEQDPGGDDAGEWCALLHAPIAAP